MQVRFFAVLSMLFVMSHGAFAQSQAATAEGDAAAGKAKSAPCAACHGVDGNIASPTWPKLAAQVPEYLVEQLKDFKSGARKNPLMSPQAARLSEKDMKDLAAYYASQKPQGGAASSEQLANAGRKLYRGGNAKTGVSACMSCHGPSGHGIPPNYPRVSGQNAGYTEAQLLAFKNGERKDDQNVMTKIAFRMSLEEIRAVSQYMAGLH
jgi:cytochrome c553